jgi:hypothetical protein
MTVAMSMREFLTIIAEVQLALRHPSHPPLAAVVGRRFVDGAISVIEQLDPGLAEMLRRGDQPEHDVPRDEVNETADQLRDDVEGP